MADQVDAIIRLRRGADSERQLIKFDSGEIVFSTDIKRLFIGDNDTVGGNNIANLNTVGAVPSPSALQYDLFYKSTTNTLYMLTGFEFGPDLIQNYIKLTPEGDGISIKFENGKYSIKDDFITGNLDSRYVNVSGDTMTGYLTLNADPTEPLHAATKHSSESYTDNKISELKTSVNTGYVHISGYDTMTGPLSVDSTFTVTQESTFKNSVDFSNSIIKKFIPVVSAKTVSVSYEISPDDNGSILVINGSGASVIVYVPSGLPKGFNVMLIQNTNTTVYIRPKNETSVQLHNIDSFYAIRGIYGVANIVSTSLDNFVIAGDLAG